MVLSSLRLHNFRSHNEAGFEFDEGVTAIVGPNGSGKTNILEAIYTLCMGKSFRDGDDELITYSEDWYRIEGMIDDTQRELRYQPSNKGKQLIIDGTSKGRFTYRHQLPVVLFEPDDLMMIHGSPSVRRKYIDDIIQKLYPHHRQTFQRYERALAQRNNLLKQRQPLSQLKDNIFVWDVSLSEYGAKIIAARQELITLFTQTISEIYSGVAGSEQKLDIEYVCPKSHKSESQLLAALHERLNDDVIRGFTTVGPHRDDIELKLNSQSARHSASRGEVRSILLSLKMCETQLLETSRGITPLFLLDDVFSELDERRRSSLLKTSQPLQTIITTTDRDSVLKRSHVRLISIQ